MMNIDTNTINLDELVSSMVGLRTLIVYDSLYAVRSLLFRHIIPNLAKKWKVRTVVYSDTIYRRLKKTRDSLLKLSSSSVDILKDVEIVKIGFKENSDSCRFIDINSNWSKKIVNGVDQSSVLILYGFSLYYLKHGRRAMISLLKMFDRLPEDLTVIGTWPKSHYDNISGMFLEKMYDIILNLEKVDMGFDETYSIRVDQSIVLDVKPSYGRFKIGENGRFVRC